MNFITNILAMTGQQSWELLAWTMCYFLAAGTVVALAGALLRYLCKRLGPSVRYAISLGVFATLALLPFGIAFWLLPSMPVAIAPTPIVIDLADTPITMSPEPIELLNITIPEARTLEAVPLIVALARRQNDGAMERAIEFLPWLWIVGTPLTFLLLATGLIGSNRLRKRSTLLTEGPVFEACQRLRTTLAVSRRVGIAINERIATPLLIGIVRPLILLPPAALTGWSPEQLEMVLLHELAHVRRWDNLVNFVQRLVESLLFFHPCVWWVSRWVRRDREECCDAVVVARTAKPQAYAELLVALATPTPTPPLAGLAMAQHPLAGRIRRILHLEEEKMLVTRSTLALVVFSMVAMLGLVLWQPATTTLAQESTATVAPGSAGGSTDDKTTEDTEIAEKARFVEYIFSAPDPIFVDPRQGKIWLATQTELIKSDLVLRQAMEPFVDDGTQYPVPTVKWLQDRLRVRFMRAAVVISLDAKKGDRVPNSVLGNYIQSIGKSYETEWKKAAKFANVNQLSPFPTLEAQKSADLAYKLLNLELEPLSKEELARVKTMKFAGGLRVASGKNLSGGMGRGGPFHSGDLLVGLHVWPTTSLAEVKKILERDDLEDLSPLKFYVIRKTSEDDATYGGEGGYGAELKAVKTIDQLVTGRIEVNIEAIKKQLNVSRQVDLPAGSYSVQPYSIPGPIQPTKPGGEPYYPTPIGPPTTAFPRPAAWPQQPPVPTRVYVRPVPLPEHSVLPPITPPEPHTLTSGDSVKVIVAGAYPDQPIDDVYVIEEGMGTLAFGLTYGRVKVAGLTLLEAEKKVQDTLKAILTDPTVQITLVKKAVSNGMSQIPTGDPSRYQNRIFFNHETDETTILYDGKSFVAWKHLWRRDLSSDVRAKAVRAFVAFANAGKSPEAIDEIFAIVAKYDWARTQNKFNGSAPAKNACLAAFTQNQMPLETAVKIIIAKKDSKNARVRAFVRQTLWRLAQSTQEVNKQLREAFPEEKLPKFDDSFGDGGGLGGGGGGFGDGAFGGGANPPPTE